MTPAQIRTVRVSFAQVQPVLAQLGRQFYDRLFTIAPELRPLFKDDLSAQEAKFMTVVSELVNLHLRSLISLPAVGGRAALPSFVELGRHHAKIGVQREHFPLMRTALIDVLRVEMGAYFTADVEDAWTAAFDVLAHAMEEGLTGSPAAQDRFLDRLVEEGDAEAALVPAGTDESALQQFFQ